MLCNMALAEFEEELLHAGFQLIRHADDFTTICCQTRAGAQRAMNIASSALKELGMELNDEKSEIMSFTEGFHFLEEGHQISLGRKS